MGNMMTLNGLTRAFVGTGWHGTSEGCGEGMPAHCAVQVFPPEGS